MSPFLGFALVALIVVLAILVMSDDPKPGGQT